MGLTTYTRKCRCLHTCRASIQKFGRFSWLRTLWSWQLRLISSKLINTKPTIRSEMPFLQVSRCLSLIVFQILRWLTRSGLPLRGITRAHPMSKPDSLRHTVESTRTLCSFLESVSISYVYWIVPQAHRIYHCSISLGSIARYRYLFYPKGKR